MGLETVNVIEDLDENWPLGTDNVSQGDDHVRNIKKALHGSFPNLGPNAVTKTADEINAAGLPVGSLTPYAAANSPTGFLICNGAAVSRTAYSALYDAIGIVWGAGDGSTTFNLPDMRNQVPGGLSTTNALATKSGKDAHTSADMPRHKHTMALGGAHAHNLRSSSFQNTSGNDRVVDSEHDSADLVASQVDGAHQHVIDNTGTNTIADNRQATVYLNWIIKT